eukprot:GHVN01004516.1.p1 GENE.GHVN01004516.1~~GHVN01004516.1.p1  ORF type:complete len:214 (+),score=3.33 GHVN01004516.1:109-750(+)
MLKNLILTKLACLLAFYKNVGGYNMKVFENIIFPFTTKYISKVHHIYLMLAFYYFWTYTAPLITSFILGKDVGTLMTRKDTSQAEKGYFERLADARQVVLNGFPGILAAVFTATLCKVSVENRVFFTFFAVFGRLAYVDLHSIKLSFLAKTSLLISDFACLFLFMLSLAPVWTQEKILSNWGIPSAELYMKTLSYVWNFLSSKFVSTPRTVEL